MRSKAATAISIEPGVAAHPSEHVANPEDAATAAAVADGFATILAVSGGGAGTNHLISATPLDIVAVTEIKCGLLEYTETFPEHEKRTIVGCKDVGGIMGR